jgi:thiamine biosynthesis lipoprotein
MRAGRFVGMRPGLLWLAALLLAPWAVGAADSPTPHLVRRDGEAMGTAVQIQIYTADETGAREAMEAAFTEIVRLERLMTTWRLDSDVSRVNRAAGVAAVMVAKETRECVARALEFSRLSGGAFDVSYYALRGLWKFDEDGVPRLPGARALSRRLPLIDYRKVHLDPAASSIYLERAGMAINLGGIGKGYAVDRATAILRGRGFGDVIVQAGGDLMLAGSQGGQPWQAGIRDPRGPREDYFAVAQVTDHAFSTAGDYERFFIKGGRRYHHIIDPRTGYPARAARSVTVWAPDATTADGLDDAILILGPERGLALVESLPGVGAVIVGADNRVYVSSRLQGVVTIVHPPTPGL